MFLLTVHNYALVIWANASRFRIPRDPFGLPRPRLTGSETLLLILTERMRGRLEAARWLVAATDVAAEPARLPLLEALEAALWTAATAAAEGAADADAFVLPTDVAADTLEAERTAALPLPGGGGGGWLLEDEAFTFTPDATDLERGGAFSFAVDLERDRAAVFTLAADLGRTTGIAAAGADVFSSCAARAWALIALFTPRKIAPFAFALAFGLRTASSATMGSSAG